MNKQDKIRLFLEIFKGRQDIVPGYWKNSKTGRSGYSPLCKNEWHYSLCHKGKGIKNACYTCNNAEYIPLSDTLIYEHFKGEHILGVYPLLTDNTCYFTAADFDNHSSAQTPLNDVLKFYEVCQVQDIPSYLFRSKSGAGYHAYLFFESPVPAWKARAVSFALLQEANIIGEDAELSSFDRLFPNQDQLSGKEFGNLIAFPFQGIAAKKGHTLFLNPDTDFKEPYKKQWEILSEIQSVAESDLDALIAEWRLDKKIINTSQSNYSSQYMAKNSDIAFPIADFSRIAEKCRFIAHCRDDAEILSEPDWYILLTISSRCRDGKGLSHKLSSPYPDYTREETDAKIQQALTCTGPYRCQTIQRINGKYCKACKYAGKVNSPIILGWMNPIYRKPDKPDWEVEEHTVVYGKSLYQWFILFVNKNFQIRIS